MDYDRDAVGRAIRKFRNEKGLTQEVCSGLAGIARSHLAMIEVGSKQPNLETIWKIASALKIPPHELVKYIEAEMERPAEPRNS
ncbi:MAG: helix-turn-helix transcriptional regulator [Clostridia bacterium]|nr:helix-turn-helix transcriptional regulator [Clostridia bacterium]